MSTPPGPREKPWFTRAVRAAGVIRGGIEARRGRFARVIGTRRVLLAIAVLAHAGCCFGDFAQGMQQGFQEGFCDGYRRDFVQACTDTCAQTAGEAARAECASGCVVELGRDPTWASQCPGWPATGPGPAQGSPTLAPTPTAPQTGPTTAPVGS